MNLTKESKEMIDNEERIIEEIVERLNSRFWNRDAEAVVVATAIYLKRRDDITTEDEDE